MLVEQKQIEKSRERIGLYRLCSFIVTISVGAVSAYGFGYHVVYNFSVIVALATLCSINLIQRCKSIGCWALLGGMIIISLFEASILQCTSLIALVLYCCCHKDSGIALLASQLSWTSNYFLGIGKFEILFSPLISVGTYVSVLIGLKVMPRRWRKWAHFVFCFLYALSLTLYSLRGFQIDKCDDNSVPYGYQIGTALETIVGKQLPENGCLYYANITDTTITNVGTVYLDHDSNTIYDAGRFEQRTPWSWNELIAAEPYRVVVVKDGCLILNLGSKLRSDRVRPLWGLSNGVSFNTLCGSDGQRLVLGDSDMVGNLLAPYQYYLIRRLAGVDIYYQIWNLVISLLLVTIPIAGGLKLKRMIVLGLMVSFLFIFPRQTMLGGVRYVGENILYPHTSLGYGVVKGLQRDSFNCLFTHKNACFLVVGKDRSAKYDNEKYVLLEPGATVDVKGEIFKAGKVPQGSVGIIPDARLLYKDNGAVVGNGFYEGQGIIFVASGSLASIDFKALQCK